MSCYMVEKKHVLYLAQAAAEYEAHYQNAAGEWVTMRKSAHHSELEAIAQILWNENLKSYNSRYKQTGGEEDYIINEGDSGHYFDLAPIQVIKSCHCFDYQACETEDYEQTEAHRIIKGIEAAAVRHLPGYEAAEWGSPKEEARFMRLM